MQRRARRLIILLFALAAVLAVGYAVRLSLDPGNYFFYQPQDRAGWVYEPSSVAFVCALMFAEAFVACLAIVAPRPLALWVRCLIALVLLGPWAGLSTLLVVHMPAYILFHHLWVWLLVASLLLTAFCSATKRLFVRFRKGPPNNSLKPTPLRGSA